METHTKGHIVTGVGIVVFLSAWAGFFLFWIALVIAAIVQ